MALSIAGGGIAYATTDVFGNRTVGTQYADGLQVSDNQVIKPIGDRVMTQYGKFMGSTVSPDGRFLAASSADKGVVLQVFDLTANKLVYRVGKAAGVDQSLSDGSVGQEGPTYSPDGKFLWLSQANALTRFPVNPDGTLGTATRFPLPQVNGASALPGPVGILTRRIHPLRRAERPEHRWPPSTRRQGWSRRPGRWASAPRLLFRATSCTSATKAAGLPSRTRRP